MGTHGSLQALGVARGRPGLRLTPSNGRRLAFTPRGTIDFPTICGGVFLGGKGVIAGLRNLQETQDSWRRP